MRLLRPISLLFAAGIAALPMVPAASATTTGTVTSHSYTVPGGLTRTYLEYVPTGPPRAHRPVVMFLHGCNQTAEQAMAASRFNELADKRDFLVVYPAQLVVPGGGEPLGDGNGIGCWNWFLPKDQQRGSGEPAVLAGIAEAVVVDQHADPSRVYVEGISAGADMSVILAATYPDVFAAAGSLAGCAYSTCGDLSGQLTHTAMGLRSRVVPMFVENGTADTLNPFAQSEGLVQSWLGADDLADDGTANGTVARKPASTNEYLPPDAPKPGSGDACIHNNTWTCPGGIAGLSNYPYTVDTYAVGTDPDALELWLIYGMEHAQPHSPATAPNQGGPYTDPLGPDITAASYDFFLKHRGPARPGSASPGSGLR